MAPTLEAEKHLSPTMEKCVLAVKHKKGVDNPYAVCKAMEAKGYDLPQTTEECDSPDMKKRLQDCQEALSASSNGQLMRGKKKHAVESLTPIREAAINADVSEVRTTVITAGLGNSRDKHFYPDELIDQLAILIEGSRSFLNHQTADEEESRSEGDVKDMCGFWRDARVITVKDEAGRQVRAVEATLVCDDSTAGRDALAKAKASVLYGKIFGANAKDVYAGISINADGKVEERMIEVDGEEVMVNYVYEVTSIRSADVVTRPARGGKFIRFLEAAKENPDSTEVREMATAEVKEVIDGLNEAAKAALSKDGGPNLDDLDALLREGQKKLKAARKALKEADDSELTDEEKKKKADEMEEAAKAKKAKGGSEAEDEDEEEDEDDMPPTEQDEEGDMTEAEAQAALVAAGKSKTKEAASRGRQVKELVALREKVDFNECREMLREAEIDPRVLDARTLSQIKNPLLRKQEVKRAKTLQGSLYGYATETGRVLEAGVASPETIGSLADKSGLPTWKEA